MTPRQITLSMWAHNGVHDKVVLELPGQFFVTVGRIRRLSVEPRIELRVWAPVEPLFDPTGPGPGDVVERMLVWTKGILATSDGGEFLLWAERPEDHATRVVAAAFEVIKTTGLQPRKRDAWTERWDNDPRFWPLVPGTLLADGADK